MFNVIFLISLFCILYILYRKYLINIMRNFEVQFQNYLSTKKLYISNVEFNLNTFFTNLKLMVLLYMLWFFWCVTSLFVNDLFKLQGEKFFHGLLGLGLPYLIFTFLVFQICYNCFTRKFVYIDEIIDIYFICILIGFLALLSEEYAIYPGYKKLENSLDYIKKKI